MVLAQVLAQRHPREKALIDDNVRAAAPSNDADEQRLLHWYTDLVLGSGEDAATRDRAETAFLNTCNASLLGLPATVLSTTKLNTNCITLHI